MVDLYQDQAEAAKLSLDSPISLYVPPRAKLF